MTDGFDIAVIGECMIELRETDGRIVRSYSGDTLNTAVYLARRLERGRVRYVTALGDDPFSESMRRGWEEEGIETSLVRIIPGALPGLYWIETDAAGERSFHYWRGEAAARRLFDEPDAESLSQALAGSTLVYFSGISLAIVNRPERLLELVQALRRNGTRVAFDPNFRPRLWRSAERARTWLERAYRHCDLAMVSFADEKAVFHDTDPASGCARLGKYGIGEVVMTDGTGDIWTCVGDDLRAHPVADAVQAVDTTGAGDAFNAAYMAARLSGGSIADAVSEGQRLASEVVAHPGALIPRGI